MLVSLELHYLAENFAVGWMLSCLDRSSLAEHPVIVAFASVAVDLCFAEQESCQL